MKIFSQPSWALSNNQQPIALYSSFSLETPPSIPPILLIGGVHGDEPEGVALAEATLGWLKTQDAATVSPWVLIPRLNPDGLEKNQRVNGHGVDLNRNYPSSNWSEEHKQDRYYPGPKPGSEPEIKAIVNLIKKIQPRIIIHCHSWEPCIVVTGEAGLADGQLLSQSSGYKLVEDIGYPTPGSLSHFGWHDLKIPVICIEEQEHTPSCEVWPRFAAGIEQVFLQPHSALRAAGD